MSADDTRLLIEVNLNELWKTFQHAERQIQLVVDESRWNTHTMKKQKKVDK